MELFDDLSSKILSGSKTAVNKAKEVVDITKLKAEIISEESKIKAIYTEIGKLYCDKTEGEIDPAFQPFLEKVAVAKAAIADYKAQIQKIRGTNQCSECGAEVAENAQFCSSCGAPVPDKAADDVEKEPLEQEKSCGCGCGCGGEQESSEGTTAQSEEN